MLCDICKLKTATVHFTEIINNKISKLHLCEDCALKKGLDLPFGKPHFSMSDLLAGLSDLEGYQAEKQDAVKCPVCGATYDDFRENGRLGCAHCYQTFSAKLVPLLKRIHGASRHTGKESKEVHEVSNQSKEIIKLQKELEQAVKEEKYERAALLRDKINEIKENI